MGRFFWLLSLLIVAPAMARASSADILWSGAQNVTGDSDVNTAGVLQYAYSLGPSDVTGATVNGVTFAPAVITGGQTNTFTNFSVTETDYPDSYLTAFDYLGSGTTPYTNLSSGYQALLNYGVGADSSDTLQLKLNNLTPGQTYTLQLWNSDSSNSTTPNGFSMNTTASDTSGDDIVSLTAYSDSAALGQYTIGTFTADGDSEYVNLDDYAGEPMMNAFQLREEVAPEPPTLLLMLLALGALMFHQFQRRRSGAGQTGRIEG